MSLQMTQAGHEIAVQARPGQDDFWAKPNIPGNPFHARQDEEIYATGEPATLVFKVVSGWVRTCSFLQDGRRQIDAFYGAGEIFGLEAGAAYTLTAEAVCETRLLSFRRKALAAPGAAAELNGELIAYAMRRMRRAQDHSLLLGRRGAVERVAGFLLELGFGAPQRDILLPMARHDIADYLGLTTETVSRTLTQLERENILTLPSSRHLVIRNAARLEALAAGESGAGALG